MPRAMERLDRLLILTLCALLAGLPAPPAWAGPSGEVVIDGNATFTRPDDQTTIIDTTTQQTLVEYDGFDILPGELVQINQPTDTSKIINYVPAGDPTQIGGQLSSNGYVYIVNPSGIFLGDTAVVDVGGLVAAAGRISYDEFMAGQERFTELGGEVVVADGARVRADDTVALLGERVANYGTIISEGGMVAFVAGSEAVLGSLDGRMIVRVDGGGDAAGADPHPDDQFALTQAGEVDAGSGRVLLSAGDTWSLAMNHSGITRGREIELEARNDGLVQVAGTLDASGRGDGETGGSIAVTGDKIAVLDAKLDASGDAGGGSIRVGGDVHGGGTLRTASRTYVAPEAELVADATTSGDGGSIAVWSEEKTGFYGSASARGGALSGDGGFIEISGRRSLEALGHHVDLSAPQGESGTLLYDPDSILIVGGSGNGDDVDDLEDTLEGGALGRILDGDPDLTPEDPFIIYESEIEGTDANIILQATTQISVDGASTFDNLANGGSELNEIILVPGNSLVIQTTGAGPDGEYAIDLSIDPDPDLDLTWKVSDGGVIDIRTQTGNTADPDNSSRGDIRVGNLVFGGRAYDDADGLMTPQLITADPELTSYGLDSNTSTDGIAVNVGTQVGDIVVGSITASGSDAAYQGRTAASSGGNVLVHADAGDVQVDWVESTGGSAVEAMDPSDSAPSEGGFGGTVQIDSGGGMVELVDHIDVSGGNGLAGFVSSPELADDQVVSGAGGDGGVIFMTAFSEGNTAPQLLITGDLFANGGNGDGEIGLDTGTTAGTVTISGSGGGSGRIDLAGVGGIVIQGTLDNPIVELQANGGNGLADNVIQGNLVSTAGGSSVFGVGSPAIAIQVTSPVNPAQTGDFDLHIENAVISANGGDAMAGGAGGTGGDGGDILIDAGENQVIAWDGVQISANAGSGVAASFSGPGARAGSAGSANSVTVEGDEGVNVGAIEVLGGSSENTSAGDGGGVNITSSLGFARVADIEVNGGDAAITATADPDLAVEGGAGGSIAVDTRTFDPNDAGIAVPGGDVLLGGRLTSFGGRVVDADGMPILDDDGMPMVASGGLVNLRSDHAIENVAPGASVEGGQVNLVAPYIGTMMGAIDIAGTEADDDRAFLSTSVSTDTLDPATPASLHVNLLPSHGPADAGAGSGFEDVTVLHADETASSELTNAGAEMLRVDGGAMPGDDVTVRGMQTAVGDPTLNFELNAVDPGGATGDTPSLIVDVGAQLGDGGGSITNNGGAILGAGIVNGGDVHVTSSGDLRLDGLAIGDAGAALRVDGETSASLQIEATGDIYVDVMDTTGSGNFGAIDVTQNLATGETTLQGLTAGGAVVGSPLLQVTDITTDDAEPLGHMTADTQDSGTTLAYRHSGDAPADGSDPALELESVLLGGDGLISATGDLRLVDPDGASVVLSGAGDDLMLDAGGDIEGADLNGGASHIQLTPGPADDPATLVLVSDGSVGSASGGALVTDDVERLAALFADDFRMQNRGDAGGIEIAQVEVLDPSDVSGDTVEATVTGVLGGDQPGDDFELDNGDNRIVLGAIPVLDPSSPATHVSVAGNASFLSPVEVENAQFVTTPVVLDDGSLGSELVAVNGARIATGGGVFFASRVDAGADDLAVDDSDDPVPSVPITASLSVDSDGPATYAGNVGATRAFERFDTTTAVLAGSGDMREIHAGHVIFRGRLDGPASAVIMGEDAALPADDDAGTSVSFGGNIGQTSELGGLVVQADAIRFALADAGSAELVNVGDGGIQLNTGQTSIPTAATISDAVGNLRFQTTGEFETGALDKLSAVGELDISAAKVTVGDLSASRIEVQSPDITVMTRAAGQVELPDGTLVDDLGVDWVANGIVATSAPQPDAPGSIGMYIGSGGISIPGDLGAYTVRYASPDLSSITAASLVGQDGRILDLTGFGPGVVGDPTRALPRHVDPSLPEPVPAFGSDAPAAAAQVSADQVLAFLRCGGIGSRAKPGCGDRDAAMLAGIARFRDSALATARAREITKRYRDLLAEPGASARLRAAFAAAGRAFGQRLEWRDGTLDGAAFYHFLESARGPQAEALASVRELAWLFAEIDMLGLADADTRRLQQTLAREFADAAGLQGFDADAVAAAVDASPVGLP
jgi:filamentous hemagglutinin family protein